MRSQPLPCEGQPAAHKLASRAEAPPRPPVTSALCAKRRRRAAPGRRGWIISEGDWPGQLFSFLRDTDGEHWRGVKVGQRLKTHTG